MLHSAFRTLPLFIWCWLFDPSLTLMLSPVTAARAVSAETAPTPRGAVISRRHLTTFALISHRPIVHFVFFRFRHLFLPPILSMPAALLSGNSSPHVNVIRTPPCKSRAFLQIKELFCAVFGFSLGARERMGWMHFSQLATTSPAHSFSFLVVPGCRPLRSI